MQYASQQTAKCAAAAKCADPATFAAQQMVGAGFMDPAQLLVAVQYPAAQTATVTLQYPWHPLGPLMQPVTLTRIATAVMP